MSAASIFATRDWLEPKRRATSVWVRPRCSRRCRRPAARASFVSMNRRSSADSSKKVPASATVHPARSSRLRFSLRMRSFPLTEGLERLQALSTLADHRGRSRGRLFAEHVENHHRIWRDVVDNAPCLVPIDEASLVASSGDRWHRPGTGQADRLTLLQTPKQEPGLDSSVLAERRGLDLPAQPDQRLVARAHDSDVRSDIHTRAAYQQLEPAAASNPARRGKVAGVDSQT